MDSIDSLAGAQLSPPECASSPMLGRELRLIQHSSLSYCCRAGLRPGEESVLSKSPIGEKLAAIDELIGRELRCQRIKAKVSQIALAQRLGISFQQLHKYETGENRIAASTLLVICAILNISPIDLLPELSVASALFRID